jgi:hypothetical protein
VSYTYRGKDRWLFYNHNIEDYYGTEMYNWYPDAQAALEGYEQEVRLLNKVRGILAEYDVTLLTFIAPSKGIVYPEYLPKREHDTTTINAREYFARRFKETGLPCFDMNDFFIQMKDTCSFYLFPPTGDHWNFSCVYATDSLLRFMEQQRNVHLPRIEYGNEYLSTSRVGDEPNRDLEGELNLIRPIHYDHKFDYKERDYWIVNDSTSVKPSALFIGNSFLLRAMFYIQPKELFSDFQFWYYNRVIYQDADKIIDSVSTLNRLDYLLDADYVVWFSSSSQMYRATEGFAEDAIIQLCIGEERFRQRQDELIDSLFHDQATHNNIAWNYPDSLYRIKLEGYTDNLLRKHPETYFLEIAGEDIPTARNPKLLEDDYWKKREIRRQIKRDDDWMMNVAAYMVTADVSLQQAIDWETDNVFYGQPTMRNKQVSAEEYREILIRQMEQRIFNEKEWFDAVKAYAEKEGLPIDQAVRNNAVYTVDKQIQEGTIILP